MAREKRERVTAKELMERLEKDEAYLRRRAESEKNMAERSARLRQEEEPLLAELRTVGFDLESVYDLVNTGEPYPAAVPILMKHLYLPYSDSTKSGIARALAVPDSIPYWQPLKDMFCQTPECPVKQGLACALSVIASKTKRYDEIFEILNDESQGSSKSLLLDVISQSRDPDIRSRLVEFADHPILGIQTKILLKEKERRKQRALKKKADKKPM
jgi:hypothetical protein